MASIDDDVFNELHCVARAVASLPRPLLFCTDIDGTLSPLAPTPAEARLEPGAHDALSALVEAGVEVAVVSGRSMAELVGQFALPRTMHLVGSHGVEFEQYTPRTPVEADMLDRISEIFDDIAVQHDAAAVERKPFACALHVRRCAVDVAESALQAAHAAIGAIDGVNVIVGHMVFEVAMRSMTKVDAIAALQARVVHAAVVFVGDDHSDEKVFESFTQLDSRARESAVAVKVGPGTTTADFRLSNPQQVVEFIHAFTHLIGP